MSNPLQLMAVSANSTVAPKFESPALALFSICDPTRVDHRAPGAPSEGGGRHGGNRLRHPLEGAKVLR